MSAPASPRPRVDWRPFWVRRLDRWTIWMAAAVLIDLIVVEGYQLRIPFGVPTSRILTAGMIAMSIVRVIVGFIATPRARTFLRSYLIDLAVMATAVLPGLNATVVGFFLAARHLFRASVRGLTAGRGRALVMRTRQHPTRVIPITFLAIILAGAIVLTFPGAHSGVEHVGFLDALFTATSAVCVTGLIVVDTATAWSTFGHGVILALIQLGGLGIMTLSATAILALGRGLGAGSQGFLEGIEENVRQDVTGSLRFIVLFTFVTEAVGAALLTASFAARMPVDAAIRQAVFHSVSAFCNAGFSTFSNSLESYVGDPGINVTVMLLIVAGGIGFPVAWTLSSFARHPRHPGRWWRSQESGTRLVIKVSGILTAVGAALFLGMEFGNALAGRNVGEAILAALFQTVTLRTAGFNTIPMGALAPATATWMLLWMFVGGSPGGTAGGVKTTTFGILALALRSLLRNRDDVEVGGRSVSRESVLRAVAVAFLGGTAVFFAVILMLFTEHRLGYLQIVFEAVSAFGTVGLSLGITPALTPWGRLIIILLMFVGRTGPLTLAFALGRRRRRAAYRYPEARILIG